MTRRGRNYSRTYAPAKQRRANKAGDLLLGLAIGLGAGTAIFIVWSLAR